MSIDREDLEATRALMQRTLPIAKELSDFAIDKTEDPRQAALTLAIALCVLSKTHDAHIHDLIGLIMTRYKKVSQISERAWKE